MGDEKLWGKDKVNVRAAKWLNPGHILSCLGQMCWVPTPFVLSAWTTVGSACAKVYFVYLLVHTSLYSPW